MRKRKEASGSGTTEEESKKLGFEDDRLFECILRVPKRDSHGLGRKIGDISDYLPEIDKEIFNRGESPAKHFIERKKNAWQMELTELKAELDGLSDIPEEEKKSMKKMLRDVEGCFDTEKEYEEIWKFYLVKNKVKWFKRLSEALKSIET